MIISVVGMPQSGTTAFYNIVNFILRTNNIEVSNFTYEPKGRHTNSISDKNIQQYKKEKVLLIKGHDYVSDFIVEKSNILFLIKRDLRESISSRRRREKPLSKKGVPLLNDKVKQFEFWCNYLVKDCYEDWIYACHKLGKKPILVEYEDISNNKNLLINKVALALKNKSSVYKEIKPNVSSVIDSVLNLGKYDKKITFFHPNMITNPNMKSSFNEVLSKSEINYIENKYKNYIKSKHEGNHE